MIDFWKKLSSIINKDMYWCWECLQPGLFLRGATMIDIWKSYLPSLTKTCTDVENVCNLAYSSVFYNQQHKKKHKKTKHGHSVLIFCQWISYCKLKESYNPPRMYINCDHIRTLQFIPLIKNLLKLPSVVFRLLFYRPREYFFFLPLPPWKWDHTLSSKFEFWTLLIIKAFRVMMIELTF